MMKKITLLFTFLFVSLGYSQSLPFDFSDPNQLMPGVDGTSSSLTTDPDDAGNAVMQVVGGTAAWDHIKINFVDNVDLSNDANNTITFRIRPTTDLGTRNHLLKFEGAGAIELPFSSSGTAWLPITLDFPAGAGNYPTMVIFTDSGVDGPTGTYLIDDIACTCGNIAPPPPPEAILPIDFSDAFELFSGAGSIPSLTTDPDDGSNGVMQVIGGGGDWDGVTLTFAQRVDLSNSANNTIAFRMKATADLGVRNHLLKFEGGIGGSVTAEVAFSTVAGTDWQNFSLDFDASTPGGPGNYDKIFIFTDAGSGATGTYLIDDIAGGINIVPPPLPAPAPNPSTPDGEVLSIYGDTGGFTNVWTPDYTFGEFAGKPDLDTGAGVNKAIKMDFSVAGYGEGTNAQSDISAYNWVHFDYFAPAGSAGVSGHQVRFVLIGGGEFNYEMKLSGGDGTLVFDAWQSVDVPLSFFVGKGFSKTNYLQYKLGTESDLNTKIVYFDNIYFSVNQGTLGTEDFAKTSFRIFPNPTQDSWTVKTQQETIASIKVFDILGKNVISLTPNADEAKIDASNLKSGLYFAHIKTISGISSLKLVKK